MWEIFCTTPFVQIFFKTNTRKIIACFIRKKVEHEMHACIEEFRRNCVFVAAMYAKRYGRQV